MATTQFLAGLKGEDWISREVRKLFYAESVTDDVGDYLTALTFLILARNLSGLETTVVSTNFDDLLEREAIDQDLIDDLTFEPIYDKATFDSYAAHPKGTPVHHIHGYVPISGPYSRIVLTLGQFAGISGDDWSEQLLDSLAGADAWLAVGMSMTDLHVLRHVMTRAKRSDGTTYVLLARHSRNNHRSDESLFFFLDKAVRDGYEGLGLCPIILDWHAELAIFLDEAWRLSWVDVDPTAAGRPYSQRFRAWHLESSRLDSEIFANGLRKRETKLSEVLRDVRDEVAATLRSQLNSDETLKTETWEFDERREHLICTASSDGVKHYQASRPRLRLETTSHWAAVQAATSGLVTAVELEATDSRWRTFFGIPLRMWDKGYDGVQAGVLVFSSTALPSSLIGDARVRDVLLRSREHVLSAMAARVRHVKDVQV